MKAIALVLLTPLSTFCHGEEGKAPPLPSTITLVSGTVLQKVSVVRWEKDAVVVKHQGGIDPVRFTSMKPESREAFEKLRDVGLIVEGVKKQEKAANAQAERDAYLASVAHAERVRKAISEKELIVGMTMSEAIQAKGKPDKINEHGDLDQWVYFRDVPALRYYVYFYKDRLRSIDRN